MAELQCLHTGSQGGLALVFIHGLGGNKLDTWRHTAASAADCWPHWLGKDADVDVWTVGYDAELSAWCEPAMALPDQADQLSDLLASAPGLKNRQLLLIGHSMGGLVAKTLVVNGLTKGDKRLRSMVERVCAMVFIATPHAGSQLASLARAARGVLRTNEQVGDLAQHAAHLRGLHQQFRYAVQERGLLVRAYAERQGVATGPTWLPVWLRSLFRVVVVDATSSDPGLNGATTVPLAGDHFSVCKPSDRSQQIHTSILDFVSEVVTASSAVAIPLQLEVQVQAQMPPVERGLPPQVFTIAVEPEEGRLRGKDDKRLLPRDGRFYGRSDEVAEVLAFLTGGADAVAVTAHVAGVGGIGKTEVCKAALKAWLDECPESVAYYVEVPDRASLGDLVSCLARALRLSQIETLSELLETLPTGLYYLDNLESLSEVPEGQQALRAIKNKAGVRVLASSRVSLHAVMGKPIVIGVLPKDAALRLFRELWAGEGVLPPDAELSHFVVEQLGSHALSVTLTARLGDCFSYAELVRRWASEGAIAAVDPQDPDSRSGSLPFSLRLTAEALGRHIGTLRLWTAAALFTSGVPDGVLAQIESFAGWQDARPWLVRHHILARRNERWYMLPPLARFALSAALSETEGFNWASASAPVKSVFGTAIANADSIASTPQSLASRAWLLANFDTLHNLIGHELVATTIDKVWLQHMHAGLINHYQFRGAQARELISAMLPKLDKPASALRLLGDLESRLGRPDEARGLYDRALPLFENEQDGLGQANTLQSLGELESLLGRPDEARGLYDRALALFENEQAGLGQANTLQSLGDLESRLGRPDEARGLYDRALALFENEQAGLGQANTLKSLGNLERRLGRPDEARGLYDRALALFENEQAGLGQANTLQSLGELEIRLGRTDEARGLYDRALALFENEQAGLGQANTLQSLGDLEMRLGRPDEARGLYDRALALFENEQDGLGQANTLRSLGDLESRLDCPDDARGLYDRALALYKNEQDGLGQANTLQSLGDLLRNASDFDVAAESYQKALSMYAKEQDSTGMAYTFAELARCLHTMRRDVERDEALRQALHFAVRSGFDSVKAYVGTALVEIAGGQEEARIWLQRLN